MAEMLRCIRFKMVRPKGKSKQAKLMRDSKSNSATDLHQINYLSQKQIELIVEKKFNALLEQMHRQQLEKNLRVDQDTESSIPHLEPIEAFSSTGINNKAAPENQQQKLAAAVVSSAATIAFAVTLASTCSQLNQTNEEVNWNTAAPPRTPLSPIRKPGYLYQSQRNRVLDFNLDLNFSLVKWFVNLNLSLP